MHARKIDLFSLKPWSHDPGNAFGLPWMVIQTTSNPLDAVITNNKRDVIAAVAPNTEDPATARVLLWYISDVMNATQGIRPAGVSWDYECAAHIGSIYDAVNSIWKIRGLFNRRPWFTKLKETLGDPRVVETKESFDGLFGRQLTKKDDRFIYEQGASGTFSVPKYICPLAEVQDFGSQLFATVKNREQVNGATYARMAPTTVARNAAWGWVIRRTINGFDRASRRELGHPGSFPVVVGVLREALPDIEKLTSVLAMHDDFSDTVAELSNRSKKLTAAFACFDSPVERNKAMLELVPAARAVLYDARSKGEKTEDFFVPGYAESRLNPSQMRLDF